MNERLWTEIKRLHKEISTGERQLDGIVVEKIKRLMRLDPNYKRKKGFPIHNPEALRWWRRKTQALDGGPSLLNTWPIKDPSLAAWRHKRLMRQQLRRSNAQTADQEAGAEEQPIASEHVSPDQQPSLEVEIKNLQKRLQTESLLLHEEVIPAIRKIMLLDPSLSPDEVYGLRAIAVLDWWRNQINQKQPVSTFVPKIKPKPLPKPPAPPKPYIPALEEPSQEEDIEFFLLWTNRLRDLCGRFAAKSITEQQFHTLKAAFMEEFKHACSKEQQSKVAIIVKQWKIEKLVGEDEI